MSGLRSDANIPKDRFCLCKMSALWLGASFVASPAIHPK